MFSKDQILLIIGGVALISVLVVFIIIFIILYQKRYYKHLREKQSLQQHFNEQLLKSQLEMQEQTFNTISSEIHDNVGQILSLVKVQLNIINQNEKLDKSLLFDAKDGLTKAMTDLRDIAKSLNSERIQQNSLPEITEYELSRICRVKKMDHSFNVEGSIINIQQQKKLIIFRIIQEAFNNIIKHSKASYVRVCFYYEKENLKITITDNGIGFNKENIMQKDGLGLKNMYSRAALVGGEAIITSAETKGTIVTIICPYA